MSTDKPAFPRRRVFFDDPAADRLLAMILTLSSEVWTLREHLAVLEAVATRKGVFHERELDNHQFTADEETLLGERRKEFIGALFRVLDEHVAMGGAGLKRRRRVARAATRKRAAKRKKGKRR